MKTIVKTAIIGCGKVAHIHARNIQDSQIAILAGVFSRSSKKGNIFAEKYSTNAYTNLNELRRQENPDAVIICTPHPYHRDPAIWAITHRIHVLVEKPLAVKLSDCDDMINAARGKGVKLGVVLQRRWYEPVIRMRRAIDNGEIGVPMIGTVQIFGWRDRDYYESDNWRGNWEHEGGGVLVNQAPHQLDLLQWLMGPIASVCGGWRNINHPYIEVEDTAAAIVNFKNGGMATVLVSNAQNPPLHGNVQIFGSSGAGIGVQTDKGAMFIAGMSEIEHPPINDLWTIPGQEEQFLAWRDEDTRFFRQIDPTIYYHSLQLEDFFLSVLENREPSVTGEEGRKTVELISAIYESQETGRIVSLPL